VADRAALLDREVTVLVARLRAWSPTWWRARGRADAAYALAARFAELASAPTPLPRLDHHVLAEQIAVTGHDLAVSAPSEQALADALTAIRRTREQLGI
jgi:hypothetical protein